MKKKIKYMGNPFPDLRAYLFTSFLCGPKNHALKTLWAPYFIIPH